MRRRHLAQIDAGIAHCKKYPRKWHRIAFVPKRDLFKIELEVIDRIPSQKRKNAMLWSLGFKRRPKGTSVYAIRGEAR